MTPVHDSSVDLRRASPVRTLLLLRHAKSSWDDPALDDHDRPLKPRGIKASRRMGRLIREQGLLPEAVFSSTAVRARETLRLLLEEAGSLPLIEYTDRLFHCDPSEFRLVLKQIGPSITSAMVVGHNPGLEEFLSQITGQQDSMPTASLARIELDLSTWSEFSEGTRGRLLDLWRPKELPHEQ